MKEIRIHGRGGQGAVLAAELMVVAAFEDGKYGQAFPMFGGERRGAAVQAFVRLDDRPIRIRTRVRQPDHVIILDRSLPNAVDVLDGLKSGGLALIDCEQRIEGLRWSRPAPVYPVPATRIAMGVFGQPLVNPAMLGAWAAATGEVSLGALQNAFRQRFPGELGDANARAVAMGYAALSGTLPVQAPAWPEPIGIPVSWEPDPELGGPGRPIHFAMVAAPRTALAYPTGGWRYSRPQVDPARCNGCGLCETYCPDGCMAMEGKLAVVDLEFCKGCGICAAECNRKAIRMLEEA